MIKKNFGRRDADPEIRRDAMLWGRRCRFLMFCSTSREERNQSRQIRAVTLAAVIYQSFKIRVFFENFSFLFSGSKYEIGYNFFSYRTILTSDHSFDAESA